jgi:group I intron endonuclease
VVSGLIYCCLSPSGKKYYGFTTSTLSARKEGHRRHLRSNKKTRFLSALRKYGWENFTWIVVETHQAENKINLKKILSEREQFWIAKDKTLLIENGYNMTDGGDGRIGSTHSEKTRKILSEKLTGRSTERKGKSFKEEMIEKYGEDEGKERYNKWIQRMRDAKKGVKKSECHKESISRNHRRNQTEETKNKIKEAWKNGAFDNRRSKK